MLPLLVLATGILNAPLRPADALPAFAEMHAAGLAARPGHSLLRVQVLDAPLHEAAASGDLELARYLLDEEAVDVDMRSGLDGATALHVAVHTGRLDMARLLIAHGADVHARAAGGTTALHMAARGGHVGALELLVAEGADINATMGSTTTPLSVAAREGHVAAVAYLLEQGARIDARSNHGRTP
ncbi:MAG: ankyrin repeat domain-containing protein, partial [Rhodovibrionaceae bacterium]|nr:ankyrin repeat domain-containing protein [Rhodovibrionaceae bacterium]